MEITPFQIDALTLEVHHDNRAAGKAAAEAAAQALRQLEKSRESIAVIFATGASQLSTLDAMTSLPGLPWHKIRGFHMDEYLGIDADHPASFRHYLRENLTQRVPLREFFEIDGSSPDPGSVCREYVRRLRAADPQLCLLGIGENGHIAFNDPGEADFHDPEDMKVVKLDAACRNQQAAEGWFPNPEAVPERALTLTIPAILRVPKLIISVPDRRKAEIVRRALTEPISTDCPATILRTHPDATLYLDLESAAEFNELVQSNQDLRREI